MEATTNCIRNREIVAERLQVRGLARKEAIRKQEEAHARFERVMIRTINEQHEGLLRELSEAEKHAAPEVKKRKVRRTTKAAARFMADADDCLVKLAVTVGAFGLANLMHTFGAMPTETAIFIRVILAAYYGYNVYELYAISGAIAEAYKEE